MNNNKIWLSSPHMGEQEHKFVTEAFDTNWILPLGPHIQGFENDIATYLSENSHVAALNSGTASIHLALKILGVKNGDDVLCASFTFSASANPITYLGANPIFIDSEEETWNIDPLLIEAAILSGQKKKKLPKAIIIVHLYGMPAKMDKIMEIASKYNIPIIEDAAEALGSKYKERYLGTFGDLGVLSFNGNKIITTSGGGALISKNKESIDKAKFLATQARDSAPHYEHTQIGYNYRMSNVLASIGRGQMTVLNDRILKKREVYDLYVHRLQDKLTFLPEPKSYFSNRWLSCALFTDYSTREKVRLHLESKNIESRPLWKPMHIQPVFKACKNFDKGVAEALFNRGLCLPSDTKMTTDQQNFVIDSILEIID